MAPFERRRRCNYNGDKEDSFVRSECRRTRTASCVWQPPSTTTAPRFLKVRGGRAACSDFQLQRCAEGCGPIWIGPLRMGSPA
jgi:hypothetical protein